MEENLKEQKSDSKNEIQVTRITEENLKEGQKVRIAPSVDFIRFIVDSIAENGLSGSVIKDKNNELYIVASVTIVVDAKDIVNHGIVVEEFGEINKENIEQNA